MNMEQIASYVSIGLWVFVSILILIGALKGRSRGICRQGVRTVTIVLSVLLAFLFSNLCFNKVCSFITDNGMNGVIELIESNGLTTFDAETKEILIAISPETVNHVIAIPMGLLILPILFTAFFVVISLLMLIVHAIVCKIAKFPKWRNNPTTRLFGAILGAIQGFAVAVIFLVPLVGPLSTVADAFNTLPNDTNDEATAEIKSAYTEYIEPIAEDSCIKTLGTLGGKFLYSQVSSLEVNGEDFKIADEVVVPTFKLITAIGDITDIDFENITEEDKAALTTLISIVNDSPYMRTLIAYVLDDVATAYTNGTIDTGDEDEMVKSILSVFVDMKEESVKAALELVRDAIFVVSVDWENITENDKTSIQNLVNSIENDDYKQELLANILSAVATALTEENTENDGELMNAVLSVFIDIDKTEVAPTLDLIVDAAFLLDTEDIGEEEINLLIDSVDDDTRKAKVLAKLLDAVATALEDENAEDGDLMNAIITVFVGITGEEVVPTLELMRDSLFMVDVDWKNMTEDEEEDFDNLIASAKASTVKADTLAEILDSVATALEEKESSDALVNAVLSVFIGIDGPTVAPALEVIRDSMFVADMDWEDISEEDEDSLNTLIDIAKENATKADILAEILDSVAASIEEESTDEDNGFVSAMLSVFEGIEGSEVAPTLEVIRDSMFMTGVEDWQNDIPDEDRSNLNELIDSVRGNEVKSEILATILDSVAGEFDDNTAEDAEPTEELMNSLFSVFDDVTKEEVVPTLEVVRDVLFMLDDENAMSSLSEDPALLSDIFSKTDENGELLIDRVIAKLNTNDNTKPLVSSFTKVSITIMAEKSNTGGDSITVTEETYDNVKSGVKDIVNINQNHNAAEIEKGTEEYDNYVADVSDALSNTFVENGFEVEKDVVDQMAEYVFDNHKENVDELSDDEANSIILNYYSAYLNSTANSPAN